MVLARRYRWAVVVAVIGPALAGLSFAIEPGLLTVRDVAPVSDGWPADRPPLRVAAIGDFHTGATHFDLGKVFDLAQVSQGEPAIVFSHDRALFPDVPDRALVTPAGHSHGGQVYLPWIGAIITRGQDAASARLWADTRSRRSDVRDQRIRHQYLTNISQHATGTCCHRTNFASCIMRARRKVALP